MAKKAARKNRPNTSVSHIERGRDTGDFQDHFPTEEELRQVEASKTRPDRRDQLDTDARHGQHTHQFLDHFPTEEELRQTMPGFGRTPDAEALVRKLERHLANTLDESLFREMQFSPEVIPGNRWTDKALKLWPEVVPGNRWTDKALRPVVMAPIAALQRPRVNHKTFNPTDQQRFNDALRAAHADGSYQRLAAVHSNMAHNMHTMPEMGTAGTQRFLPWHRIYTLKMEDLLRRKRWGITIPYWDYAEDGTRPDWVWLPPQVIRGTPGGGREPGSLPTPTTVNDLMNNTLGYTDFSFGIERRAHNGVHNWCNGTITAPATAAQDPIFWLLHSNVDRMWDKWQVTHTGVPTLTGLDAVMDPWPQTATDADETMKLGYSYI